MSRPDMPRPLDEPIEGRIVARAGKAWFFWPHDEVAIFWDEPTLGCMSVIHRDGDAGHARVQPSELGGPWVEVKDGLWVHPAHARQVADTWGLPVPRQARLPRVPRAAPMAGTRVRADDVIEIVGKGREVRWVTDGGDVPFSGNRYDAATLHGDIISVGPERWINRRRVRRYDWDDPHVRVVLDTGDVVLGGVSIASQGPLRRSLGLAQRVEDEGWTRAQRFLFGIGLRDWPFDLVRASARRLEEVGAGDAHRLIIHALWQTVRWRALGRPVEADTLRGYYYRVVLPIMNRAGMSKAVPLVARVVGREYDSVALYHLFQRTVDEMSRKHRLFVMADLGFVDLHPELRGVGPTRPDVILLCEKRSNAEMARRLAARFGVSYTLNEGQPHLAQTERLAAEIPAGVPLHVVAYVDYDHAGWIIADAFVKQLQRYGREVTLMGHLVTPPRFTGREISLYARPLSSDAPLEQTKIRKWVQRSGGIGRRPRGIHANHLLPYERLEDAFVDVTGLRLPR